MSHTHGDGDDYGDEGFESGSDRSSRSSSPHSHHRHPRHDGRSSPYPPLRLSPSSPGDIRTAADALDSQHVPSLPAESVSSMSGVSSDSWNRKLDQLLKTVKGEKYSRAPTSHTTSVLAGSNEPDVSDFVSQVSHLDPSSYLSSSGSYFSAQPPPFSSDARRAREREQAASAQLFSIQQQVDSVVYGGKAYGPRGSGGPLDRPAMKGRGARGEKILDKYVDDAEGMRHSIRTLRKQVRTVKSELVHLRRERDLLQEHLMSQNAALDAAAIKKGFVRIPGASTEKPRFELVKGNIIDAATHAASPTPSPQPSLTSSKSSSKLNSADVYLSLKVQNKSLRAQKRALQRSLDELQDEPAAMPANSTDIDIDDALTKEREERRQLTEELHQLQTKMVREQKEYEDKNKQQEQEIQELRHGAALLQAQLEVQRGAFNSATLAYQEQMDRKTAMEVKIQTIQRRLARYQLDPMTL